MDSITFEKMCGADTPALDLVFVHGITGHPKGTWCSSEDKEVFWPEWLCADLGAVAVYSLGYPASYFRKWIEKEFTIYEAAKVAIELMLAKGIGKRPIGFITHSLGGLLVKQVLRTCGEATQEDKRAILEKTKLVAFIGTPHKGAMLAELLKAAMPTMSSPSIVTLSNFTGNLEDLNSSYREIAPKNSIKTLVYYETQPVKGSVLIVSKDSADPGVAGSTPVPLEADHISICKPKNTDSTLYRSLKHRIEETLDNLTVGNGAAVTAFDILSFADGSETDRRDLLTKLIAAGKERIYSQANDAQNKFAQRYQRTGLHTEERRRNDALLSDVQQRFTLHVYQGKILAGATEAEIATALQDQVIDPICAKASPGHPIDPTAVLQSVYFLTEQCHIRWDPE